MLSDRVRLEEYEFTKEAIHALRSVYWAEPLLRRVAQARCLLEPENKPLMFEVRVAFELHRLGLLLNISIPRASEDRV